MTTVELMQLYEVVKQVHRQHADDLCWMDIDLIFVAAKLPVPDRKVGNKEAMKQNCHRFIDVMCSGGKWKSYANLEAEIKRLQEELSYANKNKEEEGPVRIGPSSGYAD